MLAFAALAAHAQYKVVDPDGRITYTDRPPADAAGRVSSLGRGAAAAAATAADGGLPFELRQIAARYPVTLYTGENCPPCDSARQMLQQRGVPYVERRIDSVEDQQALERLVGGRSIPSLTVGLQPLRGYYVNDWTSFLDAAGYPRESKLPKTWQPPPVTPLTERTPPRAGAPASAPTARATPRAPAAPEAPAGDVPTIRF